ncbi:hypothetical protein [Desulfonema limicola]|uniref:hypothetical protein n=1 Tax=Desulfonema limicola TaxID=45656 RepID=UPI001A9BE77A|nr:hypothetical protein [Desulfonema limicola]
MQYPLPERIGEPELFTGRTKELKLFDEWIKKIPKRLSKSRVILARRKSGKTAIVQRIFNRLWSENRDVIPFYYNIPERKMWFPDFAIEYYRIFASQFISFLEKDESFIRKPLTLNQIREYGQTKSIEMLVHDPDSLIEYKNMGSYDLMWQMSCAAPHYYAGLLDRRFLVILDEFQNVSTMIYRDEKCESAHDATIPGSWHELSESKIAPMLVTGSYPGWMMNLISEYFEGGRLKITAFSPYLEPDEGLQCAYNYLEYYDVPVTNQNAFLINRLCMSDPFFISCVVGSDYYKKT